MSLLHKIYRGICHAKRLCLFMAVHIDINVILLNRSTTVFCCKYMSSDDNFCSVWNTLGSTAMVLPSATRLPVAVIPSALLQHFSHAPVVCNLKIPKTCTIHICRCIDFSNASINNYLIILQYTSCPHCIFRIDSATDNSGFQCWLPQSFFHRQHT